MSISSCPSPLPRRSRTTDAARSRRGGAELAIEREIEQEHVDARLAQEAQLAPFDGGVDDGGDARRHDPARPGDARHLPGGGRGRDVRIEAAAREGVLSEVNDA